MPTTRSGRSRTCTSGGYRDGRWWRSCRDGHNDSDVEEGGRSHPTPLTTLMRELAVRLDMFHRHLNIPYASEAFLLDVDNVNGRRRRRRRAMDHPVMLKRGVMSAKNVLMPSFFFAIKLKTLIKMSVWCLCAL